MMGCKAACYRTTGENSSDWTDRFDGVNLFIAEHRNCPIINDNGNKKEGGSGWEDT